MSLDDLAARLRSQTPPVYEVGTTTADPISRVVTVSLGDKVVKAHVPGSFRSEVTSGQVVRLARVQNTRVVDSVLSALPAPAVTAAPSASGINPGANGTTSSGNYDYVIGTNDWDAVRAYTRDNAAVTRALAGDINEIRDDVDDNATDLASLKATVNGLLTTIDDLIAALLDQGRIT